MFEDWDANLINEGIMKIQPDLPQLLEEPEKYYFGIPMRVEDIRGALNDPYLLHRSVGTSLFEVAKLVTFTDTLDVKPLSS